MSKTISLLQMTWIVKVHHHFPQC